MEHHFEVYQRLPDGRKRLVALCDADSDAVTLVHDAAPVRMAAAPPAKPKPRPQTPQPPPTRPIAAQAPRRLLTMQEALQQRGRCPTCGGLPQACTCAPAPLDTTALVVEEQTRLGLR